MSKFRPKTYLILNWGQIKYLSSGNDSILVQTLQQSASFTGFIITCLGQERESAFPALLLLAQFES